MKIDYVYMQLIASLMICLNILNWEIIIPRLPIVIVKSVIGFILYGPPKIEELSRKEANNAALHLEWGHLGSYYQKSIPMDVIKKLFSETYYIIAPVWKSLLEALNYGTTVPMQALIPSLKVLYERVKSGYTVNLYYPAESKAQPINLQTFDQIVCCYFDDFVLEQVKLEFNRKSKSKRLR